jgi:hypothetical protein
MQETDLSVCPLEVFRMLKSWRIGVFLMALILHDPVAVLLFYFPASATAVCAFRNAILGLCKHVITILLLTVLMKSYLHLKSYRELHHCSCTRLVFP